MNSFIKRNTLSTTALVIGLLAALPLAPASAQSAHEGHHPQNAPAAKLSQDGMSGQQMQHGSMMDHGSMDHERMMKQMHAGHMNQGQMDHGNMGQGQMNHGSMPPAKAAPKTKDGKDGQ